MVIANRPGHTPLASTGAVATATTAATAGIPTGPEPAEAATNPVAPTSKRTVAGYPAFALALVACPCHLPLTLGLVGAAAGGTAVAAWTASGTLLALATLVFLAALGSGWWLLQRRRA